jgi:hypothetical protein
MTVENLEKERPLISRLLEIRSSSNLTERNQQSDIDRFFVRVLTPLFLSSSSHVELLKWWKGKIFFATDSKEAEKLYFEYSKTVAEKITEKLLDPVEQILNCMNMLNQENLTQELNFIQKKLKNNKQIKSLIEQLQLSEGREQEPKLLKLASMPLPVEFIERLDQIIKLLQEVKTSPSLISSEGKTTEQQTEQQTEQKKTTQTLHMIVDIHQKILEVYKDYLEINHFGSFF